MATKCPLSRIHHAHPVEGGALLRNRILEEYLPFWAKLSSGEQTRLDEAAVSRTYEKGERLHNGRADCNGLFLVTKGRLRVFLTTSDTGREITLYRLLERDICLFSASCILQDIRFEVFVEAERQTEVLIIPAGIYQELLDSSRPAADYTSKLMASRFSDVMWVMEQLLFSSLGRRLGEFLLEQRAIEGGDRLSLTHEEIARHLGSAREVVTRMLRYFQSEGLVSLSRGGITLLDPAGLAHLP